ncbi:MAG: thioesterase superfamily protein [Phycisphaerales bacterium]|nr:thioesterase superfamily protein [Phycisphaerales bacterium]
MSLAQLPHTAGCLVCGRDNPHGLQLSLHVDTSIGEVSAEWTPKPEHIGFQGIVHGGILATVLDEAMVWAATWSGKRFCVCGELNVRYRQSVSVGVPLVIQAKIEAVRSRLIEVSGLIRDRSDVIYTATTGKYVPITAERNMQFVQTLIASPSSQKTMAALRPSGATEPS